MVKQIKECFLLISEVAGKYWGCAKILFDTYSIISRVICVMLNSLEKKTVSQNPNQPQTPHPPTHCYVAANNTSVISTILYYPTENWKYSSALHWTNCFKWKTLGEILNIWSVLQSWKHLYWLLYYSTGTVPNK